MVEEFGSGGRFQSSPMVAERFQRSDGPQGSDPKRQKIGLPPNAPRGISPLGLTLTKTPSFVELIETKLTQQSTDWEKIKKYKAQSESEKLKASNFPALSLQIGSWKRGASNDGDIVAKCYFAKKKLVWEILHEGLKRKMEIQWHSISAIRATFAEGQPSSLEIELNQCPKYFRETNPQPRKHTNWENCGDFTGGQAEIYRRHILTFPEGTLEKHYEKLVHSEPRLFLLNRRPFPTLNSPFFPMVPNELQSLSCDLRSKHPCLYNQPPVNMFTPQQLPIQQLPPQIPPVRNLGTINTPTQHTMSYDPIAPSINSINSRCSLPLQAPTMGDMSINSLSAAMNIPPINEDVSIPMVMDPMSSHSVNNLHPIKVNAAMHSGLQENIPVWDQGVQNITDFVGAMENQSREISMGGCATSAPDIHPRRARLAWGINAIARQLFSELQAPIYADKQSLLAKVTSIRSAFNEVAQVAPTQGHFNQRNGGEYTLGDPSSSMAPRDYNQNEAQVAPPSEGFNWGNDGAYNLGNPNSSMATRDYNQTEGLVALLPEGFNLITDGGYNLCDRDSSMAPRDYNETEGQVALLSEGFMPMNDGGYKLGVLGPSVGMERDQETVTNADGNSELLHPFLHYNLNRHGLCSRGSKSDSACRRLSLELLRRLVCSREERERESDKRKRD